VATEREISRIRHDHAEWTALVRQLLAYGEVNDLEDRHVDFLESLQRPWRSKELSYRQVEWLLDIRDSTTFLSQYRGVGVKFLMRACFENRFGIDDMDDVAWVEAIWAAREDRLRKRDAQRLFWIARSLDAIDD
jgi:hypothetical protein